MIIDSHVHLKHGGAGRTEYTADQIVRIMDATGIDKSVVFAMSTTTRRSVEMAQDAAEQFHDRLIPYVYALPSYQDDVLQAIEGAIVELQFRGIKVHAGECTLAEYVSDPVFALAGECGVPCLVDCTGRLEQMQRLAAKYPGTRIIVAHLGRYLCTDKALLDRFIALAEQHENILLDVSGVVLAWKIAEAVRRIGSSRILFGTDGPHEAPDTVAYARAELDKIRMLHLDEADEKAVLGESIARVLHLETP